MCGAEQGADCGGIDIGCAACEHGAPHRGDERRVVPEMIERDAECDFRVAVIPVVAGWLFVIAAEERLVDARRVGLFEQLVPDFASRASV